MEKLDLRGLLENLNLEHALKESMDKNINLKYCIDEPGHICLYIVNNSDIIDIFEGTINDFLKIFIKSIRINLTEDPT